MKHDEDCDCANWLRWLPCAYRPGNRVRVTLFDLKYNGRIMEVTFGFETVTYLVRYADDKGDLCTASFREDEIEVVE